MSLDPSARAQYNSMILNENRLTTARNDLVIQRDYHCILLSAEQPRETSSANTMAPTAPFQPPRATILGRHRNGFTLIEMMVVLIIVGVIVSLGMVRLTTDDDAAQVRREAERLSALLHLARDEAIVRARSMGLRLTPDGYRFALYDDGRWRDLDSDTVFRARRLPDHLRLAVHGVSQAAARDSAGDGGEPPPQVILTPGGEATPFELSIARLDGGAAQRIHGGAMGRFTVETGDDS